jgi:hypothetical protein
VGWVSALVGTVQTKDVPVYNDNNTAIKVSNSDFSQLLTRVFLL